ncbi:MAG: GNAT family N-acetyltransferase, partial [Lachnospiraceae bacterium]|nr:GNAT family N-acetyltransferase [Lachnospiraceae bacterium]
MIEKMIDSYIIRTAVEEDAQAVHDIYGAYIEDEDVTFTIENPSVEEYRQKIIHTKKTYPFYVAETKDGKVLGYVYGSPLRPHDAYKWNVESTIVLAPDAPRRQGIGTALYKKFMDTLKKQGF